MTTGDKKMIDETVTGPLQMQPTFRVELPWAMEEAKRRIRQAIASDELAAYAETAGWVIDYKVETSQRRFWSPHLSIQLHRVDESQLTEAFCRFSPRPEIWTMVMAVYLVAACCLSGALIFGFVQWMMGNPPWALLAVPCAITVIVALHIASLVGQGWSRDQMHLLRARWERTLELAEQEFAIAEATASF